MKKRIIAIMMVLAVALPSLAQSAGERDRIEACKENYRALFGGEALTGKGTDPEMMDILQKFIFGEVFRAGELDMRTREMITCVTLASLQALPQLKSHAGTALNVGVTPVELREAMYLTAPFVGFPKMLNAVGVVNEVFAERGVSLPLEGQATVTEENRHERGAAIQDSLYAGGISAVMAGVPGDLGEDVARFLTDYFFGEIYTRGGLDLKTRELLGYCVLTAIGADSQLRSHFHGCLKAGNRPETIAAAEKQAEEIIAKAQAQADRDVLSAQVQEQEEINAALADDIANSDDPEYLANIARIKLGLLKPDEIEFVDTSH